MNILILGDRHRADELLQKLPKELSAKYSTNPSEASLPGYDVIFDLNFDDDPRNLQYYGYSDKLIFAGAVKQQLAAAVDGFHDTVRCHLVGMNTLPSFINRPLLELSLMDGATEGRLKEACGELNWEYRLTEDRVGMVTPRIILMIINEACYTLQEGTASVEDIDVAMRLGTNYPFGPFTWADKIGVREVYDVLQKLYADTKDERYKICPLLKTMAHKNATFYKTETA